MEIDKGELLFKRLFLPSDGKCGRMSLSKRNPSYHRYMKADHGSAYVLLVLSEVKEDRYETVFA